MNDENKLILDYIKKHGGTLSEEKPISWEQEVLWKIRHDLGKISPEQIEKDIDELIKRNKEKKPKTLEDKVKLLKETYGEHADRRLADIDPIGIVGNYLIIEWKYDETEEKGYCKVDLKTSEKTSLDDLKKHELYVFNGELFSVLDQKILKLDLDTREPNFIHECSKKPFLLNIDDNSLLYSIETDDEKYEIIAFDLNENSVISKKTYGKDITLTDVFKKGVCLSDFDRDSDNENLFFINNKGEDIVKPYELKNVSSPSYVIVVNNNAFIKSHPKNPDSFSLLFGEQYKLNLKTGKSKKTNVNLNFFDIDNQQLYIKKHFLGGLISATIDGIFRFDFNQSRGEWIKLYNGVCKENIVYIPNCIRQDLNAIKTNLYVKLGLNC